MSYRRYYPWQLLTRAFCLDLSYKLPFSYDPKLLREDLRQVLAIHKLTTHFRHDHHDGGWNAIGLVTADGNPQNLYKGKSYSKTATINHTPYVEHIIDSLPSIKQRVRLMRLEKKKNIFWHFDAGENMDGEVVRLHSPVVTNNDLEFQISHQSMRWHEGELWYGDFSFPHRLRNGGEEDRVHLVIDLEIDNFIRGTFPENMKKQGWRRKHIRYLAQHLCSIYNKAPRFSPLNRSYYSNRLR